MGLEIPSAVKSGGPPKRRLPPDENKHPFIRRGFCSSVATDHMQYFKITKLAIFFYFFSPPFGFKAICFFFLSWTFDLEADKFYFS